MLDFYRAAYRVHIADQVQYRFDLLVWILSLLIEPVIYMTVWTNVAQNGVVEGYTAHDFVVYYVAWMFVQQMTFGWHPEESSRRIRLGMLSPLLLRPVNPFHEDFAQNLTIKTLLLPIVLLAAFGLGFAYGGFPQPPLWSALAFLPVLAFAYLTRFVLYWWLGLLAFWFVRLEAIYAMFFLVELFLTGRLAPLTLLPEWAQVLASLLPFRWVVAFPVDVLLGSLTPGEVALGLVIQMIWLAVAVGLMKLTWRYGTRRYAAVGG